jgi:hypothetical protein
MTAVEAVGDPQQCAHPPHDTLIVRSQRGELWMLVPRPGAPMIPADQRHERAVPSR